MKIPNFREKGTKLPIIPSGTQYRCTHWPESNKNSYTNNDFVSFGYKTQSDFDYIICEKEDYKGTNYYMIPESIIIDLWKKENNYVENTMEKEIIGYKLIKPEYEQAALALVNMKTNEMWNSNLKEQGWMFKPNSQNSSVFEQAGVLDLWFEPVYKKDKPFFKVYVLNNGILKKHSPKHKFTSLIDIKSYFETLHVKYGRKEFQVIVQKYYGASDSKIVGVYDFEYKGTTSSNQFKRI